MKTAQEPFQNLTMGHPDPGGGSMPTGGAECRNETPVQMGCIFRTLAVAAFRFVADLGSRSYRVFLIPSKQIGIDGIMLGGVVSGSWLLRRPFWSLLRLMLR